MRDVDLTTTNREGATTGETFTLGHWEAMQIAIALDNLADSYASYDAPNLDHQRHTRELSRVFGRDALYSIVRVPFIP